MNHHSLKWWMLKFSKHKNLIAHIDDVQNEAHHNDMCGFKDERRANKIYIVHLVWLILSISNVMGENM